MITSILTSFAVGKETHQFFFKLVFMQGLNFVFICVLLSSFIFVHSIASCDATFCRLFGISRGRESCHRHVTFSKLPEPFQITRQGVTGSYSLCFKLREGEKFGVASRRQTSLASRLRTASTCDGHGCPHKEAIYCNKFATSVFAQFTVSLCAVRFRMPLVCFTQVFIVVSPGHSAANTVSSVLHLTGFFFHPTTVL